MIVVMQPCGINAELLGLLCTLNLMHFSAYALDKNSHISCCKLALRHVIVHNVTLSAALLLSKHIVRE
jgi:hypothetical protein